MIIRMRDYAIEKVC